MQLLCDCRNVSNTAQALRLFPQTTYVLGWGLHGECRGDYRGCHEPENLAFHLFT
jgi:hypothetical protein